MFIIVLAAILLGCSQAAPQGYGYGPQVSTLIGGVAGLGGVGAIGGAPVSAVGGQKYLPPGPATQAPLVRKQFYLISAPEDHSSLGQSKHLVIGRPQKNYRVVFIKAPSSNSGNVKLTAEYAPQEEKTVIYVLSKKDNDLNVNDIATPAPTQPSKPEIFFIKYKTPEEAIAAQREIQAQYDRLGGTNEYTDEGTAPISSVIGSLDGQTPDGAYDYRQGAAGISQYLPPVLK